MAHEGQVLEASGIVLTLVRITPERLEMEAAYDGTGGMPPSHLHPRQDERFEVLDGTMHAIVGDDDRRYAAGEGFDVPAGTAHQMAAEGPTRVRWTVTPALRTAEFFEGLYGGRAAEEGLAFLEAFRDEVVLAGP